MKPTSRTILTASLILLTASVLGIGTYLIIRQPDNRTCQKLDIRIADQKERQYTNEAEIAGMLLRQGLHPVGKALQDIDTQPIEDAVRQHEMVRTAECYKTQSGDVRIELTQRIPLLRVVTPTETYYIDTDRRQMPARANIDMDILTASGHVGLRMAQQELADFAVELQKAPYWKERITRIEVHEGKQIVLRQHDNEPRILLGSLENHQQKLRRLRTFIQQTDTNMGIPTYREFDLRYKEQVIGRK